jgi:predicted DCC family thiol-disulfide oxidoreductase YuxK
VQFVIKHDAKKVFRFASLQGAFGQSVLTQHQLPKDDLNSFILIEQGILYTKSTAALRVAKQLNGGWKLLYGFIIVPPFIRNAVYSFIARNRYKWFGKQDACWLPTPELRSRFFD